MKDQILSLLRPLIIIIVFLVLGAAITFILLLIIGHEQNNKQLITLFSRTLSFLLIIPLISIDWSLLKLRTVNYKFFIVSVLLAIVFFFVKKYEFFIFNIPVSKDVHFTGVIDLLVAAPFIEEIIFRGYVQRQINKNFNIHFSILFTSIFFSFYHLQIESLLSHFLFSVFAGYLFYKSGSLSLTIFFHFVVNLTIYFFL